VIVPSIVNKFWLLTIQIYNVNNYEANQRIAEHDFVTGAVIAVEGGWTKAPVT